MKKKWLSYAVLIALSLVCLIGLTTSEHLRLGVRVPRNPFIIGDNVARWDRITYNTSYLDDVQVLDWDTVLRGVENRIGPKEDYFLEMREMENLVRNNLFSFSRLGICTNWNVDLCDFDLEIGYKRSLGSPDAFTLAKLLTDASQEEVRKEFLKRTVQIMQEPASRQLWSQQRDVFVENWHEWVMERGSQEWQIDYYRMLNADYDSSMQLAYNNLIRYMNATDFSLKVIPGNTTWRLVRLINNFFELVTDDTPMKISSICYRIGPEATEKLIGYVKQARDDFSR